jgi:hypothetical protein
MSLCVYLLLITVWPKILILIFQRCENHLIIYNCDILYSDRYFKINLIQILLKAFCSKFNKRTTARNLYRLCFQFNSSDWVRTAAMKSGTTTDYKRRLCCLYETFGHVLKITNISIRGQIFLIIMKLYNYYISSGAGLSKQAYLRWAESRQYNVWFRFANIPKFGEDTLTMRPHYSWRLVVVDKATVLVSEITRRSFADLGIRKSCHSWPESSKFELLACQNGEDHCNGVTRIKSRRLKIVMLVALVRPWFCWRGLERKWWGVGPAWAEGGLGGADILNSACRCTIRPAQVPMAALTYSTSNWRPSARGKWLQE